MKHCIFPSQLSIFFAAVMENVNTGHIIRVDYQPTESNAASIHQNLDFQCN